MTGGSACERALDEVERRAVRAEPRLVAIVGAAAIAVVGSLGALEAAGSGGGPFDLDGEYGIPAAWSGLLLGVAALLMLLVARRVAGRASWLVVGYALFLLLMGLDETLMLHERLESWTGVRWQYLYAPVVAVAGIGWLRSALLARDLGGLGLLVGGAAAWGISQVLELFQWSGEELTMEEYEERLRDADYLRLMVPEEILEMVGSLLFLLAGLVLLRALYQGASRPRTVPTARPTSL